MKEGRRVGGKGSFRSVLVFCEAARDQSLQTSPQPLGMIG
ncbi:unnamed protein product [Tuber melanosporum]|uniref:(Perigord truffle) hypothetical protein n=1 Tax=Tuber melanosporum (strain Mel28) TaxID=656061 RepID=D5GDW7_TUBMM|nr:uncharacterized protein GSTUM_00006313001 [Tuber melanosporum]CAZ82710.1 unnamed protein product [Tuber melanosporum]